MPLDIAPHRIRARVGIMGLAVLAACQLPTGDGIVCLAVVSPAVTVTIRDAATGEVRAGLAQGTISERGFVDSLVPHTFESPGDPIATMRSRQAGFERPGRYDVRVDHPGYQPWIARDVVAPRGPCGVETRELTADLIPIG